MDGALSFIKIGDRVDTYDNAVNKPTIKSICGDSKNVIVAYKSG